MIPLSIDVPMKRLPWANWALILLTVFISLAVPYETSAGVFPGGLGQETYSRLVLQRGNQFAGYQLLTALFQHAGLAHLLGNMLFLFLFGNAINAKLGHLSFLACYLGIGILVNEVWWLTGPGTACLGASGAIMGMCGMFLVLYPFNSVQVFWNEFQLSLIMRDWTGEVPGWAAVLLFLAFDLWGAIVEPQSPVGHVSHIVGGVAGVGVALVLLLAGWLKPDRGEQTLLQWLAGEGPTQEERPRRRKKRKKAPSLPLEENTGT
jgi:membrane associated rhomboid family serine protease